MEHSFAVLNCYTWLLLYLCFLWYILGPDLLNVESQPGGQQPISLLFLWEKADFHDVFSRNLFWRKVENTHVWKQTNVWLTKMFSEKNGLISRHFISYWAWFYTLCCVFTIMSGCQRVNFSLPVLSLSCSSSCHKLSSFDPS